MVANGKSARCALILTWSLLSFPADAAPDVSPDIGEMVFRQGKLPDGALLRGMREGGGFATGKDAACINCHRRSGLGSFAGRIVIPPIIGKYLFRSAGENAQDLGAPHVMIGAVTDKHSTESYTETTVANAIRSGTGRGGHQLNYLMPRFELDERTMASLISYLKNLSVAPVPGVTDDTLHFATIITPDVDPAVRQGMLEVMSKFIEDKNSFIRGGNRPMKNAKGFMYRVTRRWQLHVWQVYGPPDTWESQLQKRLAAEPVFAVISGLGGKSWDVVHQFCQREQLPCLFPNVDGPVVKEDDFYSVYFTKGVALEAQLFANRLSREHRNTKPGRVIQIFRPGDIGERGAQALAHEDSLRGIQLVNRRLSGTGNGDELSSALRDVQSSDIVILWLRPQDLKLLPEAVPTGAVIYASGLMAGEELAPLSGAWRSRVTMSYPHDLPENRRVRMNYPLGWFKVKHIPVVSERIQSDTYLALGIVSEALTHMLDSFQRDYLIERIEDMLSRRLITGYYPRLSLAPGQRFASKGGYLVHLEGGSGTTLVADGDWIVP
jgi:hypothetical protein